VSICFVVVWLGSWLKDKCQQQTGSIAIAIAIGIDSDSDSDRYVDSYHNRTVWHCGQDQAAGLSGPRCGSKAQWPGNLQRPKEALWPGNLQRPKEALWPGNLQRPKEALWPGNLQRPKEALWPGNGYIRLFGRGRAAGSVAWEWAAGSVADELTVSLAILAMPHETMAMPHETMPVPVTVGVDNTRMPMQQHGNVNNNDPCPVHALPMDVLKNANAHGTTWQQAKPQKCSATTRNVPNT
jgi:hypothetical protein